MEWKGAGTAAAWPPDWYPHPDWNGDDIQLRRLGLWFIKLWGLLAASGRLELPDPRGRGPVRFRGGCDTDSAQLALMGAAAGVEPA